MSAKGERTMATMTVSLPSLMKAWVEAQIKGGRYATSSDYVRDLIRRDQEYREKLQQLQSAIDEGRDSGLSDRTPEDILAAAKADLRGES